MKGSLKRFVRASGDVKSFLVRVLYPLSLIDMNRALRLLPGFEIFYSLEIFSANRVPSPVAKLYAGCIKDVCTIFPGKYNVRPTFGYTQYYGSGILVDVDVILNKPVPTLVGLQINKLRSHTPTVLSAA